MPDVDFWVIPRSVESALANGRAVPSLVRPRNPTNLVPGAVDEWRFGLGDMCQTGITNRTLLTANGDPAIFTRNTLQTAAGNLQGLVGVNELSAETHLFVVKNVTPSGTEMIAGTMSATTTDGGWGIYRQGTLTNLQFLTRGITTTSGTTAITTISLSSIPEGMPFFVGISHSSTQRLAYVGGVSSATSAAGTHTVSTGPRKVSIGNVHYTNAYSKQTIFYAYATIAATKVAADMDSYYATMKAMMRLRGVNVF